MALDSSIFDFPSGAARGTTSARASSRDAPAGPTPWWARPWTFTGIFAAGVVGVIALAKHVEARRVEEQAAANEVELLDLLDDLRFELALRRRGIEP